MLNIHKKQRVLQHLLGGFELSSLEAYRLFKIIRLSDHIYYLKKEGHNIQKRWEHSSPGTHYAVYFLINDDDSGGNAVPA